MEDVTYGPRARTSCETTIEEVDNLKILGDTNRVETNIYHLPRRMKEKNYAVWFRKQLKR